MSKLKTGLLAIALLAAVPASALADVTFTMPEPGWALIGKLNDEIYLAYSKNSGQTCKLVKLSGAPWLTQFTRINGSSGSDFIAVAYIGNFTICGKVLRPVGASSNGSDLQIVGNGGADIIGGGLLAATILGGAGDDTIEGHFSGVLIDGGSDDDWIATRGGANAGLIGGTGDDLACVLNSDQHVFMLDGGANDTSSPGDRFCGSAWVMDGWEASSCAGCF